MPYPIMTKCGTCNLKTITFHQIQKLTSTKIVFYRKKTPFYLPKNQNPSFGRKFRETISFVRGGESLPLLYGKTSVLQ